MRIDIVVIDCSTVVVPVFNPEAGLVPLCVELMGKFPLVVVVDDGSIENRDDFNKLPKGVILLRHAVNRGKGCAIKTALKWLLENREDVSTVVFVDGDGQHRVEDAVAVAEHAAAQDVATLGVRDFGKAGIPFRSRFGNVLTSWLVRRFFKFDIHDTQTGLRAYPRRLWEGLLALEGERYEYEMRLFGFLRSHGEHLAMIPIQTLYIENNRASHFRPIVDSVKIYRGLFGDVMGAGSVRSGRRR